jgi:phosphoribosylamine-glycine ligase
MPTDLPLFFDFDIDNEAGFFMGDLRKEDGQYYITGQAGNIGYVVGSGKDVEDAQEAAYSLIHKIRIPSEIIYNPTIGDKFEICKNFLKRNKII